MGCTSKIPFGFWEFYIMDKKIMKNDANKRAFLNPDGNHHIFADLKKISTLYIQFGNSAKTTDILWSKSYIFGNYTLYSIKMSHRRLSFWRKNLVTKFEGYLYKLTDIQSSGRLSFFSCSTSPHYSFIVHLKCEQKCV